MLSICGRQPSPLISIIHLHSTLPTCISSFTLHLFALNHCCSHPFAPDCILWAWVGLSGLVPIVCVGTCYLSPLAFTVFAFWPLVCVCLLCAHSVCSTLPVKAILVFFKRMLCLPLHLRLKIPVEQMNSWLSSFIYHSLSCGGGERQDVAWLAQPYMVQSLCDTNYLIKK